MQLWLYGEIPLNTGYYIAHRIKRNTTNALDTMEIVTKILEIMYRFSVFPA